jgi:hypothetical protein
MPWPSWPIDKEPLANRDPKLDLKIDPVKISAFVECKTSWPTTLEILAVLQVLDWDGLGFSVIQKMYNECSWALRPANRSLVQVFSDQNRSQIFDSK